MTRATRFFLIGIAAVIAVGAILLLGGAGDDSGQSEEQPAAATATPATPEPTPEPDVGADATPTATPTPKPEPKVLVIRTRGSEPVGGVQEIEVEKGERIRFEVRSDTEDEVHVHGYDVSEEVGPDRPAEFSFPADIEGIFEVELEHVGVPIAELKVEPR